MKKFEWPILTGDLHTVGYTFGKKTFQFGKLTTCLHAFLFYRFFNKQQSEVVRTKSQLLFICLKSAICL